MGIPKDRDLKRAIKGAKAALVGDSNDSEHDALVALVEALGLTIPDCECVEVVEHGAAFPSHGHESSCPCYAWQEST